MSSRGWAIVLLIIAIVLAVSGFILTYKSCDDTKDCTQDKKKSISGAVLFGFGIVAAIVAVILAANS